MTSADEQADIYLIVETGCEAGLRLPVVEAIFDAAPCSALLIAPGAKTAQPPDAASLIPLIGAAQSRGVAALVADDAELARSLGADGVHLVSPADVLSRYHAARQTLGPAAIVGAEAGLSRDTAMRLGEAGADYVFFARDGGEAGGSTDALLDIVAWWAELVEVPCVGFVSDPADALAMRAAGADFIAVTVAADEEAALARTRVLDLVAVLDQAVPETAIEHRS